MLQRGYSYLEILVATAFLAIALPAAMQALDSQVRSADQGIREMQREYKLDTRMDEVLARPLSELELAAAIAGSQTTPSEYSDASGTQDRVIVYLAHYDFSNADADGDPFTNPSDNLLWVRSEIEGTGLYRERVITWR